MHEVHWRLLLLIFFWCFCFAVSPSIRRPSCWHRPLARCACPWMLSAYAHLRCRRAFERLLLDLIYSTKIWKHKLDLLGYFFSKFLCNCNCGQSWIRINLAVWVIGARLPCTTLNCNYSMVLWCGEKYSLSCLQFKYDPTYNSKCCFLLLSLTKQRKVSKLSMGTLTHRLSAASLANSRALFETLTVELAVFSIRQLQFRSGIFLIFGEAKYLLISWNLFYGH